MYFVRELFEENDRMAWMVEIEISVLVATEQVRNGLPRTRKKRRLEEGRSKVRLRSLKEEIIWFFCELGLVFSEAEMVRSGLKIWYKKEELAKRDG